MVEILLCAIALLVAVTAGLATLVLVRLNRATAPDLLTREVAAGLLRVETEILRRAGDEGARALREEFAARMREVREGTAGALAAYAQGVEGQLRGFGERLDGSIRATDRALHGLGESLEADIAALRAGAEGDREALRALIEGRLAAAAARAAEDAAASRDELGRNVRHLGATLSANLGEMGERQRERLEANAAALAGLAERHERTGEALRLSVEARLEALAQQNAQKLDEMRQTVDEKLQSTLETRLGESFNRVVEQLNRVHEGLGEMKSLAANVGDLRNVLTNVKVRGTFGEVQLELLLEQFLTREQYVKDARVKANTTERVEFAVRFPGRGVGGEVLLPIDAKFPRETYDRLVEASQAGDDEAVRGYRRQLEAQVRACAKEICAKYVNPPATTDFAILFLPTEGLYAEVLRQVGVFECLQRDHKVTLAGPTTLCALLNALQMGFRSLAIEKRSSEVWEVLGAVQHEFGKYNQVVDRLATQLSTAANSVENLGKRTRAMNRRLRTVEALPEGAATAALLGFEDEAVGPLPGAGALPALADDAGAIRVKPARAAAE